MGGKGASLSWSHLASHRVKVEVWLIRNTIGLVSPSNCIPTRIHSSRALYCGRKRPLLKWVLSLLYLEPKVRFQRLLSLIGKVSNKGVPAVNCMILDSFLELSHAFLTLTPSQLF